MITKLQVKYIQSLRQKKLRDEEEVFVAEGPKIINELLAGHAALQQLYATPQWIKMNSALLQNITTEKIAEVQQGELERLSFLQTPNEVMAIFKKPASAPVNFSKSICLMLDGIQDPGNLGTIIRIADWFNIRHIICSMDCADAFSPKVVQATMGSILRVQLLYTDLMKLVDETPLLKLYAAALSGKSIYGMAPLAEGVIVIGNESKGIRADLLNSCKYHITIPRPGRAESLNAAVACGIILSRLTVPLASLP